MEKMRLDLLLVQKGHCSTRSRAQELIAKGAVLVDGKPILKAGEKISAAAQIYLQEAEHPYVSRGGSKLAAALDFFSIDTKEIRALDVGASTGGFTHCLLLRGAKEVFCVDVGTAQLAELLRQDSRVHFWEQTNIKDFSPIELKNPVDLVVVDVSFVSAKNILPYLSRFLRKQGHVLFLIKPQFEVGPENLNKRGIVKSKNLYQEVIQQVVATATELGFVTQGTMESPILGGDGNVEFFLHAVYA